MGNRRQPPLLQRSPTEKLRAVPRSLLWATGAAAFTAVFGAVAIPAALILPYSLRYGVFLRWSYAILWWTRMTCGIRCHVEGAENIPGQPCIVLCKHQSAWETMALQYWFNPQTWVLKRELLRVPVVGWALALLAPIAIDRGARKEAMQQMLEQGRERLRQGRWIVVFPEGTRIPAGRSGHYRRGGAVLACATGSPVIPVAHNAGEVWPRHSFLKYPGTVHVRIGPPMVAGDESSDAFLARIREWIETNSRAISRVYEAPEKEA
ncbi:lysophospholipid acyltransferase family protein [Aquisalimonas lutea]|uniref:lysophospholipid acyltransferase family protein n=1 Tax=Aquisalimonas lutea TaxID=1327750 RepID=UPI0025B2B6EF|nr:lysophospholipid acyltransferase family protein [Aquisalimonas lutea]MDN3516622.1 lysophospholipid acyltransferase family protein [Aquisalimonas lutea]